jgi:hypothetical protein
MKTLCHLLLVISCFAATAALADTRARAITITTDAFPGSYSIDTLRAANGALTGMVYSSPNNPNGTVYTLAKLASGPQVLLNSSGHDAVLLSLNSDFNAQKGGHLTVRYLNSGIDDSYKNFRILVDVEKTVILRSDPDSNDPDSDNNSYTSVFDHLFLQKNTFFGKVIGIDQIVPSEQ